MQTDSVTGQGKSDVDDDEISMEFSDMSQSVYDQLLEGRPREYPRMLGRPSRLCSGNKERPI